MTLNAPPIDSRTAAEIERQVVRLMTTYVPEWSEFDPATGLATGMSGGLVGAFARFAELTLQRLNRVPEKNELAFLDLVGAAPLPASPARAPLTFALAAGATVASVPARTQVATPPVGQAKPVMFETLREMSLTATTLAKVVTWDAASDARSDHSAVFDPSNTGAATLFVNSAPAEHALYVGDFDLFSYPIISGLSLNFSIGLDIVPPVDPRTVQWEIWDGAHGTPLTPIANGGTTGDTTAAMTTSGQVYFGDITQVPVSTVAGLTCRWMRCRLLTPITASATPVPGFVRASQTDFAPSAMISAVGRAPRVLPDAAYLGAVGLDVSKDFLPFGPDPKFGATWYLACRSVLSQTGRRIALNLTLSDPKSGFGNCYATQDLAIKWEYWTDSGWTEIGTSTISGAMPANVSYFVDGSAAFQSDGEVSFVLERPAQPTVVNGVENLWLRIRIVSGHFLHQIGSTATGTPSLQSAQLYYDSKNNTLSGESAYYVVREDAFGFEVLQQWGGTTAAFAPAPDTGRSLYLGFAVARAGPTPVQAPISLWANLAPVPAGSEPDDALASASPVLTWSYWDGATWSPLTVADDTDGFMVSGEIRFLPQPDLTPVDLFKAKGLCWLRATWTDGHYKFLPRLQRLLINTTLAEQAVTIADEKLGSSNGLPGQTFAATQAPVFDGLALDVVEPEIPPRDEEAMIAALSGSQAITIVPSGGVRVRWSEVGDFYASGPRDRHFVVDHQTGVIRFGDGVAGMIPPRGSGNVILARYRTGSGLQGDVAAGAITQLKTTLPYVSAVSNPVEAAGGVDAETIDAMRARAPRLVRHGGRAVTIEDFQDLARMASPEVALSQCVPLVDLSIDPDGATVRPGVVSVIVVPQSSAASPAPSVDLVERVHAYLAARALASVAVVVVAPEYVTVDVHAQVSVTRIDGAAAVEAAVRDALTTFLHPLTGGPAGTGWAFGRRPYRSDLIRLLQGIAGVDHLRGLDVVEKPPSPGTIGAGRFLVCSGVHRIDLSFGTR